jgi:hypothetical protein
VALPGAGVLAAVEALAAHLAAAHGGAALDRVLRLAAGARPSGCAKMITIIVKKGDKIRVTRQK